MVIAVDKSVDKLSNITMEKFDAVFEILETIPAKIRDIIMECIGSANGAIIHQEQAIKGVSRYK